MKNTEIHAFDGYIAINNGINITWVGKWANEIRYIYYEACKKSAVEPSLEAISEFINKIIIPKTNGIVILNNI
mgnify:CR=1 FL=1